MQDLLLSPGWLFFVRLSSTQLSMGGRLNLEGGTLNFDGGTLTLDGGDASPLQFKYCVQLIDQLRTDIALQLQLNLVGQ